MCISILPINTIMSFNSLFSPSSTGASLGTDFVHSCHVCLVPLYVDHAYSLSYAFDILEGCSSL